MQDAITNVINQSDVQGLYLDTDSMGRLEQYFASGELRVRAAATISANASNICLLYTSPSPRDMRRSRMPSSA